MEHKSLNRNLFALSLFTFFCCFFLGRPTAVQADTYTIGTDITFAPFEFQNEQQEYVGIDIDLLKAIAKAQNFTVDIQPVGFNTALQSVEAGQLDGMIAGMSITEERKAKFDFSDPYFDSGIQMVVKSDNQKIKDYQDLKGKTVGAKSGTESADFLDKNQEKYGFKIKLYDTADVMYDVLNSGNIDAVFDDYPVIGYAITQGQKLKTVTPKERGNSYGFAVKKGTNAELLKKFNTGLKELKANGQYQEILDKYIATNASETAEGATEDTPKVQPLKDKYTIGTDLTFAPFEFQDEQQNYVGIDIDLMNEAAKLQGFTIDIKPVGFNTALQSVEAGQLDGMIAGMSITEERKAKFDFSDPYFESGIQLVLDKDNKTIQSYEDLQGKTVGAKNGTDSAAFLEENKAKYGYSIKLYETADVMYDVLGSGNIDAAFDDYPVIGYAIKQGKPLKTVTDPEPGGKYGFAVKKGANPELLAMFNAGLKQMKASGEYQKILDRYIEQPKTEIDRSIWGLLKQNYPALLKGLWFTIYITVVSILIASVIGIFVGLMNVSRSKILRFIGNFYVDIIRGIPLYVFALLIYVGIPNLTGTKLSVSLAGIITLSLNAGAYIAEIVRGGINAVPVGQTEAARSLGLSYGKTMRKIVLPQAIKLMIPSFINQFVITLKDTTILSAIGMVELLQSGKIIVARTYESFKIYFILSIIYIVVITVLTKLSKIVERRVQRNG